MSRMGQVLQLDEARKRREKELRKLSPSRQAWVKEISAHHPEWGPKEIESLHDELEAWGE
jgi:hypothetical protein